MEILLKLYPRINLGDDLFLKIICERYTTSNFYLLAGEEYNKLNQWPNLKVYQAGFNQSIVAKAKRYIFRNFFPSIYRNELQKIYSDQNNHIIEQVDAFVSIGGSIFMEKYDNLFNDPELAYYNMINFRFKDKLKFFVGCNFGPYKTESYLEEYKNIFQKSTDVCFRENYSFDLFKNLEQVRIAPDVVFGMPIEQQSDTKVGSVGFSIVTPREGLDEELYCRKYAELIDSYQNSGNKVYLFSFCQEEGDEVIIEKIITFLNSNKDLERIYYKGNIDEFLKIYASMEYMFCGRFHAMILSMMYKQKIFPVIYSKKMANVLEDINYSGETINIKNFGSIDVDLLKYQIENNKYCIEVQKKEANKQFLALDKFIGYK